MYNVKNNWKFFILKPIGHFIYLFIYFAPYVVRHLRTTIIRGDRTRRWQWSVYVTKRKKKKKEEEQRGGKRERGRRGGVEEEETREERRFTNGQQLAVYSFGHGFLDTLWTVVTNRFIKTGQSFSTPPSFSCLHLLADETGPVAHFPFVSHQLLPLLRIILPVNRPLYMLDHVSAKFIFHFAPESI